MTSKTTDANGIAWTEDDTHMLIVGTENEPHTWAWPIDAIEHGNEPRIVTHTNSGEASVTFSIPCARTVHVKKDAWNEACVKGEACRLTARKEDKGEPPRKRKLRDRIEAMLLARRKR
jgi:hypothetical protein